MTTATLADLRVAATDANTELHAAETRLEQARRNLLAASTAHHQAIVDLAQGTTRPPAAQKKTTGRTVDPVAAAEEALRLAREAFEKVSSELGV